MGNLIDNAINHTSASSYIEVGVELSDDEYREGRIRTIARTLYYWSFGFSRQRFGFIGGDRYRLNAWLPVEH